MSVTTIEAAMPVLREPLQRLLELYQHDLSDIWDQDLDEAGCYGYELDRYADDPSCSAWLIRADGRLAGCALVDRRVRLPGDDFWMDQFFVLRKYRRQGVGQAAATLVFRAHPGRWQVGQMTANHPAQAFWRRTIGTFSAGAYEERQLTEGPWQGLIQQFNSPAPEARAGVDT